MVELNPIDPFTEEHFNEISNRFTEWATEKIKSTIGWKNLLNCYHYNDDGWKASEVYRRERSEKLHIALANSNSREVENALKRISCDWAGLSPNFLGEEINTIVASFKLLDQIGNNNGQWEKLFVGGERFNPNARIAPVSAIYEHYDLNSWIFYSSFVGESIALLLNKYSEKHDPCPELEYIGLRAPPGDRNLPAGFALINTKKQARLSFIYMSWMCKALARAINEKNLCHDFNTWKPFHVEMALMCSSEIRRKC